MRLNIQYERPIHITEFKFLFCFVFFLWKAIIVIALDYIIISRTPPLPVSTSFTVPLIRPFDIGLIMQPALARRILANMTQRLQMYLCIWSCFLAFLPSPWEEPPPDGCWLLSLSPMMNTCSEVQSLIHSQSLKQTRPEYVVWSQAQLSLARSAKPQPTHR